MNNNNSTSTPSFRSFRKPRKVGKIYHPVSADGYVCANFYTRVYIKGKAVLLNLGLSKQTATELDRDVRARLRASESLLSVKVYIAKRLERMPSDLRTAPYTGCPTVGDIITAHQAAYLRANSKSTATYRRSFLNFVETVVRHRHHLAPVNRSGRKVTLKDYQEILDLPISILDDVAVADFRACRMEGITRGTPAELSAQTSVNAELVFAKAMFSAEAMIAYKQANLTIPDLTLFRQTKAFPRLRVTRVPPAAGLITGLHAAVQQLALGHDEALFIIVVLALFAGLRRTEILNAHTDWLQSTHGPTLVVRIGRDFIPKSRRERMVPLPDWLYARLSARPADYLIGQTPIDRVAAYERALQWLRDHGLAAVDKPLHFLRGLNAGFLLSRFSIFAVKSRLGHEDIATTLRHYAERPYADSIAALWDVVLPSTPACPQPPPPAIATVDTTPRATPRKAA